MELQLYFCDEPKPTYMAETITTLSNEFGVDRRTLLKMIKPIEEELTYKQDKRIILTVMEENLIRDFIGLSIKRKAMREKAKSLLHDIL